VYKFKRENLEHVVQLASLSPTLLILACTYISLVIIILYEYYINMCFVGWLWRH